MQDETAAPEVLGLKGNYMQLIVRFAVLVLFVSAAACGGSSENAKDTMVLDVKADDAEGRPDINDSAGAEDATIDVAVSPADTADDVLPPTDTNAADGAADATGDDGAVPADVVPDVAEDTTVTGACPTATTCIAGHCIPIGEDGQCVIESDCPVISSCNAGAVGGICLGCGTDADCPGSTECTPAGACAESCGSSDECPFGRCATGFGYCVQKTCGTRADCPVGAECADGDCVRITCPNPCAPNPCTAQNRAVCEVAGDTYDCSCNDGYRLDATSDACVPETAPGCDAGFACEAGLCVKESEPFFQCAANADCGGALTCSPALPSGQCRGCASANDCPPGYDTCTAGFCLRSCTSSAGCHSGMSCSGQGFCGQRPCASDGECGDGYRCDPDSSPRRCVRKTCP